MTGQLPAPRETARGLLARTRGALTIARDLVVPGAAASAIYLLVPGQWVAFKSLLAGWGIPVAWGAALAPVVLGAAIMGVRWAARSFRDADASRDP